MSTFVVTTADGKHDYIYAATLAQAIIAGQKIFGGPVEVREATREEEDILIAAHSIDVATFTEGTKEKQQ